MRTLALITATIFLSILFAFINLPARLSAQEQTNPYLYPESTLLALDYNQIVLLSSDQPSHINSWYKNKFVEFETYHLEEQNQTLIIINFNNNKIQKI